MFHTWETATNKLTRFEDVATVKECSNCNKIKVKLDRNEINSRDQYQLKTEAGVVMNLDTFADESVEGQPNKYDKEVASQLLTVLR